jgi:hypothetical protein
MAASAPQDPDRAAFEEDVMLQHLPDGFPWV